MEQSLAIPKDKMSVLVGNTTKVTVHDHKVQHYISVQLGGLTCNIADPAYPLDEQKTTEREAYDKNALELQNTCHKNGIVIEGCVPFSQYSSPLKSLTEKNYVFSNITSDGNIMLKDSNVFTGYERIKKDAPLPQKTKPILERIGIIVGLVVLFYEVIVFAGADLPLVRDTRSSDSTDRIASNVGEIDGWKLIGQIAILVALAAFVGLIAYSIVVSLYRKYYYHKLPTTVRDFFMPLLWPSKTDHGFAENMEGWKLLPLQMVSLSKKVSELLARCKSLGFIVHTVIPEDNLMVYIGDKAVEEVTVQKAFFVIEHNGVFALLNTE
ncbi:MAG TPA: hypothetical protein VL576_03505 [Candidatus Paceibacterota bacterium]|jgi:hypothetical protein|nr:hypothetical protein [Candidatus Paceibacterota bacterium]